MHIHVHVHDEKLGNISYVCIYVYTYYTYDIAKFYNVVNTCMFQVPTQLHEYIHCTYVCDKPVVVHVYTFLCALLCACYMYMQVLSILLGG